MGHWPATPEGLARAPDDPRFAGYLQEQRENGRRMGKRFAELTSAGYDGLVAAVMTAAEWDTPTTMGMGRALNHAENTLRFRLLAAYIFQKYIRPPQPDAIRMRNLRNSTEAQRLVQEGNLYWCEIEDLGPDQDVDDFATEQSSHNRLAEERPGS